MGGMAGRLTLALALVLLLTCTPTALPRPQSEAPAATPAASAPSTTDLVTLREGNRGPAFILVTRSAATSAVVRELPDAVPLRDGSALLAIEPGLTSMTVRKIDRRTGATLGSGTVPGFWSLDFSEWVWAGASPDGTRLAVKGNAYNSYDDSSRTWVAHTSFAVVNTRTWKTQVVELVGGGYTYEGIANDGATLYVGERRGGDVPSSVLRAYDLATRAFADIGGDAVADLDRSFRTASVSAGPFSFQLFASQDPVLVRLDLDGRAARVLRLPPVARVEGEASVLWSVVSSRDGRTLWALNPAAGVIDEIDVASMRLRRTAPLSSARSRPSLLDALLAAVHPVAYAKPQTKTGAVLSPDGTTLYAIGQTGLWAIDTGTLAGRTLVKAGEFTSIALSPDGARLYALGLSDGVVRVLDSRDGALLGAMKKSPYALEIVAVDAG